VRKQVTLVVMLMLGFAGAGSSTILARALAQPQSLTAVQQEKRLGPKPTPHWYWRWLAWRLGEGYAKGRRLQPSLRPNLAPSGIPPWAWRRLHFFLLARRQSAVHSSRKGNHRPPPTTTTVTTTTTETTTTSPTSGGETYEDAISYTQTRPSFTPTRTVEVSNASQLLAAISNLEAGDLVKATGSFTVSGETVIKNRLSAPAELDLGGVSFVYSGGRNLPAVWLNNAQNVYIFGGDASTADTGGSCILDMGSQHVLWWGFTAHDCGGDGFAAYTATANVDHLDIQGTIWKVGQNLAWDPHAEKGTGLHCAGELWDANTSYTFTNNRFAFSCHDIPTGDAVAFGNDQPGVAATGNVLYLKAVNLTNVSLTQTGGNGLCLWGDTNTLGLDVKYLEVDNAQGRAVETHGVYSGQTLHGVTIEYGRASNTNLNTSLDSGTLSGVAWDTKGNPVYQDIASS
jgi:hypothetical protein